MKHDAAKSSDTVKSAAEIEAEEQQAVAILARRLEAASGKASRPDYVPTLTNPVARN